MSEGRATARYVRTSAQKAKLVMDLIRGQSVDRALSTLRFARKRIARDIEKVLRSAVANAQQKAGGGEVDRMFVSSCYADQGPSMKRIRPAPMGRAFRIVKRTAHLTVQVSEHPEVVTRVAPPASGTPVTGDAAAPKRAVKRARKTATTRTARKTTARASTKTARKTTKKATAAKKATAKTATAKTTKKSAGKKTTD